MSSHQESSLHPDQSQTFYEGSSESPVIQQLGPPTRSWPQTTMIGGYCPPDQPSDPVGNSLNAHDEEDMNIPPYFPDSGYPIPAVSQGPTVGTSATHINDNIPYAYLNPSFVYGEFSYGQSQQLYGLARYSQVHDHPTEPFGHEVAQHATQVIHIPQASQGSFTPVHLTTSQIPSLSHGGPVYRPGLSLAQSAPSSLTLDGANTARTDASARPYSYPSPVATSSANQESSSIPGRQSPGSPERKRLLPVTAEDTARRVVPRHVGVSSVHSTQSGSHSRSGSNSDVHGRGPWIPQERYRTSGISYHGPDQHPTIFFNLGDPDETGIPIMDILDKTDTFARLRDRTETFDMGKKTFTLRVQWPGYKSWSKTIAAMDWTKSRSPVSRLKLADAVATGIRDLFEKYRDESCDEDHAKWKIGPNGLQLNQICLVALHHVSRGSWQPALCLLEPRG